MGVERLDRAQRQQRAEPERHIRRAPDFGAGGVDRERQALAAERFRTRHRIPAGRGPAPIGVGPAGRGGHLAAVELDAVLVADPVQRRQHVAGEFSGFLQHGGGDVGVEIAVMAGLDGGLQAGAVIEGEQHVIDRRAVAHVGVSLQGSGCRLPTKPPSSQLVGLAESRIQEQAACRQPAGAKGADRGAKVPPAIAVGTAGKSALAR